MSASFRICITMYPAIEPSMLKIAVTIARRCSQLNRSHFVGFTRAAFFHNALARPENRSFVELSKLPVNSPKALYPSIGRPITDRPSISRLAMFP